MFNSFNKKIKMYVCMIINQLVWSLTDFAFILNTSKDCQIFQNFKLKFTFIKIPT